MPKLNFRATGSVTDASVRLGDRHDQPGVEVADLLGEMDRHGVTCALAWHAKQSTSAIEGNRLLAALLAEQPRVTPLFSAVAVDECLADLQQIEAEGRLTAVRWAGLYRRTAPFADWLAGPLLGFLTETRTPLWVAWDDVTPDLFVRTAGQFPQLRIVLTGLHFSQHVFVRPLLRVLPNVMLELSRYETLCGVENVVREFGAERFVYGSGYPDYAMGPVLFALHHMELPEEDQAAICHDNLQRLLATEELP